jgi:hypothetical protein
MPEYVVLIVGDGDRWWTTMSEQERKDGYAEYGRFAQQLGERGHQVVGGAELQASTTIRTVQPGGATVTDGPFAETAEQVGGYFHIETEDLDDLLECCKIIAALGDAVQVVPTVVPEARPS